MNPSTSNPSESPALRAGDSFSINLNQADRDAVVLAVLGGEYLASYAMPAGRVFLIVCQSNIGGRHDYRSMALKSMPKKWIQAIRAQGCRLTIGDALANLGYHDRSKDDQAYALAHRVPQWVKDLNPAQA